MKRAIVVALFLVLVLSSMYSREPIYRLEKAEDGTLIVIAASEEDALIIINEYSMPEFFILACPITSLEYSELFGVYILKTKMLTDSNAYGYRKGIGIMSKQNSNFDYIIDYLKQNTVLIVTVVQQIKNPTTGETIYSSMLRGFVDQDFIEIK